MKDISNDVMALTGVKVIKEYLNNNTGRCGEGYWQHIDGAEFNIAMSDFNDGLDDFERFLQQRINKAIKES